MGGLLSILSLFRNSWEILGTNVRFYLSYDIKITLKSHFLLKCDFFVIVHLNCYGRHNVSRKSVNH